MTQSHYSVAQANSSFECIDTHIPCTPHPSLKLKYIILLCIYNCFKYGLMAYTMLAYSY